MFVDLKWDSVCLLAYIYKKNYEIIEIEKVFDSIEYYGLKM